MANATIVVDEGTSKKARMRALEETSVNAVLRDKLEEYASVRREQMEALEKILASSRESTSARGVVREEGAAGRGLLSTQVL